MREDDGEGANLRDKVGDTLVPVVAWSNVDSLFSACESATVAVVRATRQIFPDDIFQPADQRNRNRPFRHGADQKSSQPQDDAV